MSTTPTKRILILGATSYIGRHLLNDINSTHVTATYCSAPLPNGVYFDALTMSLDDIIQDAACISSAIILFGNTDPDSCAMDIKRSWALNVESVQKVLKYLKQHNIKPIFLSSEFVFDGRKGNYTEQDTPNPILTYGRQKLLIEQYIQENFKEFIIVRLAKVFGSESYDGTLFTSWLNMMEEKNAIRCARDQFFSPIYVNNVIHALVQLLKDNLNGIFHLSNQKAWCRIDLLKTLIEQAKPYGLPTPEINLCSIHDFDLAEKRPVNVSMQPDKLIAATGIKIDDVGTACQLILQKRYKKYINTAITPESDLL